MVLVSSEEYMGILTVFSSTQKIKVSDYCVGADKDPDLEKLFEDVQKKTDRNILIGLGDYLICKGNLIKKILQQYIDLVFQNNGHVVILLPAEMYSIVEEIQISDPRVRTRVVLPEIMPEVTSVTNKVLVCGIKAYLEARERGEYVQSVKSSRNIQTVHVIDPENAFDELKHKFPNEFSKLSPSAGTSENWRTLLENLNNTKKNMMQFLNSQDFVISEYNFLDYAKESNFKSWLFFINLKLSTNNRSYLGLVASKAHVHGDLCVIAKIAILDIPVTNKLFKEFYEQRKKMLKGCNDVDMADYVSQIHIMGVDRIAYLTDNTKLEKQTVIVSICKGAKSDSLAVSYPDLYLYLQDFQFDDERFTKYFSDYKLCKLNNSISESFSAVVRDYAINRPFNSLSSRASLISSLDDGNTTLIFLDAFGVEYLGFVKEKCAELKLRFVSKIARADLPTVTSVNRGFYDDWKGKREIPIKDLDELKHHPERGYDSNNSPFPIHLVEELRVIREALERAKLKLLSDECKKVLIVSDHGASRLAVISSNIQLSNNNCETKSSGRYCIGKNLPFGDNIITEGEYAVIADYSRFTSSRAASVEVHGGATLEEVLVPIIELTLINNEVQVMLESNTIEISYKDIPTLIMSIIPDFDNVTVSVAGNIYKLEKLEKGKYCVTMAGLKSGKYVLDVFESQNRIASKEFVVKSKGFAERDMF